MSYDPTELLNSLSTESLAEVNTAFPLLKPGQYQFVVDSVEVKENDKDDGTTSNFIEFKCKLNEPAETTAGEALQPGYPVRHMINLRPSEKQIKAKGLEQCVADIKRDIAKFIEAMVGPSRHYDSSFQVYRGQTFFAKTKVSKERTDKNTGVTYDPQTEFQTFIPRTEDVDAVAINSEYANANPF